jgi:hyaluronan synthase
MIANIVILSSLSVPIVIGFILKWDYSVGGIPYSFSVFATMSVIHFLSQLGIGYLNHRKPLPENISLTKTYGVQVTGWKEDRDLFEKCLISIKNQSKSPSYITFCSDGNEVDDEYMIEIFQKVYPKHNVIKKFDTDYIPVIIQEATCISQPHRGKRHAMYTQIKLLLDTGVDYIMFVDSDTILDKNSIEILLETAETEKVDAVTGDVRIYNRVNLLSLLISLKYWYAFNIERSAQSYFKNVSCMAGPFSLYRTDMLQKIVEPWIEQTFLGKECTFGDDRHLTNLVLKNGGQTAYTHRAVCYTDTPVDLRRFITQQTRWGKSFVREYLINFTWFNSKQLFLLYDINFMTVYSLFLTAFIITLAVQLNYYGNMAFLFTVLASTMVRSMYAILLTGDISHIMFVLYGYVYLLVLIPVKFWAIVTLNKTGWGTGSRLVKTFKHLDIKEKNKLGI